MSTRAALAAVLALAVAAPLAAQQRAGARAPELTIPSGWDDDWFAKMEKDQALKLTLAVADVGGKEELEFKAGVNVTELLGNAVAATGKFLVVERARLDEVLEEQKLQLTGVTDETKAVQLGNLLGSDAMLFTTVARADDRKGDVIRNPSGAYLVTKVEVVLDARLVNAETGEVMTSASERASREGRSTVDAANKPVGRSLDLTGLYADATREAAQRLAARVAAQYPLAGMVLKVAGQNITLNLGEDRGVKGGDRFIVFRKGAELKNPGTGEVSGYEKSVLGAIEVFATERQLSTGRLVQRQGTGAPKAGDLVISAPQP
ncbi:MAG: CsgG/HfaB family protein [Gemmatimonadales bacterium]|nr:CsgG/HfaB family protein [Gemmatimonadales bacterium]